MTIAKYRPQSAFISPFGEMVNEFLHRDIGQFLGHDDVRRSMPGVNIVEREKEFELQLQAPGYTKEDLKISMENEVLTVSAEHRKEELKENERWTRREFITNGFSRSFRLPETVNVEAISAEFNSGVLAVRIPKAEANKPKAREITIG
ncbi:MAG: Hsp20/alpha crystallin family protein [Flavobacteriales bacterium]|nr:Hsp20/alpha crystallin family protein [Flavobacteriales bacterium]